MADISIHPPRAGRDKKSCFAVPMTLYFNPPAPCGAGRLFSAFEKLDKIFQSTRPVRGGTCDADDLFEDCRISIHPPRAGRDLNFFAVGSLEQNFNPPAPCGAGQAIW